MVIKASDGVWFAKTLCWIVFNRLSWWISFCTVKFRIKSFRVPELFIEVPETETVGSLKV